MLLILRVLALTLYIKELLLDASQEVWIDGKESHKRDLNALSKSSVGFVDLDKAANDAFRHHFGFNHSA